MFPRIKQANCQNKQRKTQENSSILLVTRKMQITATVRWFHINKNCYYIKKEETKETNFNKYYLLFGGTEKRLP